MAEKEGRRERGTAAAADNARMAERGRKKEEEGARRMGTVSFRGGDNGAHTALPSRGGSDGGGGGPIGLAGTGDEMIRWNDITWCMTPRQLN